MRRPFVLEAELEVAVSVAQAQQWFLGLEDHPERYRFETYAGFEFTQGGFGEIGSRFVTRERFYGLTLALHFVLGQVEDRRFFFYLRRPPLPIWGAFVIEESGPESIRLALQVGGTALLGEWFLKCPPVCNAVGRQIGYEVQHIKASMEALYAQGHE